MAKEKPINTNSSGRNIITPSQNLHHQVSQDQQDDLEGILQTETRTKHHHYVSTQKRQQHR